MATTTMVDTDALGSAVVHWVNTFDCISRPCRGLDDLDGPAIFHDILTEIDPQWFKPTNGPPSTNWVMNFNGLKKLHKLILGYYQEVLGFSTSNLEVPNLTLLARDADPVETLKLAQLVVALAVQCEGNQRHVAIIQTMDAASQHALMLAIETVMSRLETADDNARPFQSTEDGDVDGAVTAALLDEKAELERSNRELASSLDALRLDYEKVTESKDGLEKRLKDMEGTLSHLSEAGQVDFLLRTEIDNLKASLLKSETRRTELEVLAENSTGMISDMKRKLEAASEKAEQVTRLQDSLDEFRHTADKLQKSEALLEKYKKRFEDAADLRRQLRAAEDLNAQHALRNANLEEEFRKVAGARPLVETLREQLAQLETRNGALQVENSTLEFQLTEARTRIERSELEKRSDGELIQSLEDQLKDLEYQIAERGGVSGGRDRAEGEDGDVDGASGAGETLFSLKVTQLEREVERLRGAAAASQTLTDKVMHLQGLLEDAERLTAKYEHDYKAATERNVALENEISQLQAIRENGGAQRSPTSASASVTLDATLSQLEAQQKQIVKLTEDLRQSMGRYNKISHERERLQMELADAQTAVNQHDRVIAELRGDLAAMESVAQSSDEGVQKLANITKQAVDAQSQNDYLHTALKAAKEHIRRQENALKDLAAAGAPKDDDHYREAVASLEAQIQERDAALQRVQDELMDTRAAARREQRLMASAWYATVTEQQIKASARLKVVAPAADGSPQKSWLQRERARLDQFSMGRR
ncbi:hypothetical protein HDU87_006679 [Geranomyces variabilis]|uniref:Uncharacterized protein n=1 Tax=Geranomyces variabilis TaxID=109894 RepID=A0AAD5TUI4_9FUNG|nr:hypothetical protein HDU87_006679 [Geranomyces variabilis]